MKRPAPVSSNLLWAGGLIILVFLVVLLWLPGWLQARNQTRVWIVSDNPTGLADLVQADDFKIAGIQYGAYLKPEFLVPGVLDGGFDEIFLYQAPVCDRTARQVLADYVQNGGKLVVIGDACTRVVDSDQTGWNIGNNHFTDVVPAVFDGTLPVESKLKIYAIEHPVFNGIKNQPLHQTIALVRPTANATVLAFINSTDVESGNSLYGILEQPYGKGRVVYFAYDPVPGVEYGGSRNLVLNLMLYLAGRPVTYYPS